MFKNKPVTLTITAFLLIVLIVVSATFQFFGRSIAFELNGGRRGGGPQGSFQPGQMPEGFTPPNGGTNGEWTPPDGSQSYRPGSGSNDGSYQRPSFSGDSTTMKLFELVRGVQTGGVILIALLGILAVVGIFLGLNWGRTWAIVTAILSLVLSIPSLFVRFFGSNWIETLVKIVLAVAVLVLCFLPKSRQAQVVEAAV